MRVLILGHKGMLGHMVNKYFSIKDNCEITTTDLRWPTTEFKNFVTKFWQEQKSSYIVNCIGAIHQRKNNFDVNIDLPIWLDDTVDYNFSNCKVIHAGTDSEMDDDEYGISKRKATEYILKNGRVTKIIKTSIFGPELKTMSSMFEWFMNSKNEVYGWIENYWNGITTLEWAKVCYAVMLNWNLYDIVNIPTTKCISKYKLLNLIKEVFGKEITIHKNSNIKINKCLEANIKVKDLKKQIIELKEFYYDN
jgi:dTDP-4-dehydrorhamnose reductase